MTEQRPSIGRIVHYTLNEGDVEAIDRLTPIVVDGQRQERNPVAAGHVYPAMVVRVFDPTVTTANLQVFLDGALTYWTTSRTEGDGAGHWTWPPRV
jgi:hypothetical protein